MKRGKVRTGGNYLRRFQNISRIGEETTVWKLPGEVYANVAAMTRMAPIVIPGVNWNETNAS